MRLSSDDKSITATRMDASTGSLRGKLGRLIGLSNKEPDQGEEPATELPPAASAKAAPAFVERFPRLLETSQTAVVPERLNRRHTVLIDDNRDLITGKRILDLASHDGRWSLAALEAGAAHVTGIEARPHLVENARANCLAYGIESARFDFVQGDVFDVLRNRTFEKIDTVFCFGFFYHVAHHVELIALIERIGPKAVLVDTAISPADGCSMDWLLEEVADEPNIAADRHTRKGRGLVGVPTRGAVSMLWGHFGYHVSEIDWSTHLKESAVGIDDYLFNKRASFRAIGAA